MCLRGLFNRSRTAQGRPSQADKGSGGSSSPTNPCPSRASQSSPPTPTTEQPTALEEERATRPIPAVPEAKLHKGESSQGSAAVVPPSKTVDMPSLKFMKQVGKGKGYGIYSTHCGPDCYRGFFISTPKKEEQVSRAPFQSKLTGSSCGRA